MDMRVSNTDTKSYKSKSSAKVLETAEKEEKDKYLHACLNGGVVLCSLLLCQRHGQKRNKGVSGTNTFDDCHKVGTTI